MNSEFAAPARFFTQEKDKTVLCGLCPRNCRIAPGKRGFCAVRENHDGKLVSLAWGRPVAIQVDPVEKKPFACFLPGTAAFSIGTFGCNLNCVFCQNDSLSRGSYGSAASEGERYEPDFLADLAVRQNCRSVALTYNEPTVWAEYAIDIAKAAKKRGLAVLLVSNGFISRAAAEELYPLMDAANIDMKGFSEEFYREMCGASLRPVLEACEFYASLGGHLELTNLVIPGKNDSEEMIFKYLDWAFEKFGRDIPLHFSAYHPAYRCLEIPPTPAELLRGIAGAAKIRGFRRVFLGNI